MNSGNRFFANVGASIKWEAVNELSIIVQGGLFAHNARMVGNNCYHWRQLFPESQIILAISSTDIVEENDNMTASGRISRLALAPRDGIIDQAISIINDSCDIICFADSVLALPPIKSDSSKLNNVNLQIAAAKIGLKNAKGKWTLRVRSDLIFLDRSFLDYYFLRSDLERGEYSALESRVMISWLYTINPYTSERMPLHFSDWFNFGLTKDIINIWSCDYISVSDAMYYVGAAHATHSNASERLFNTRLAVEQHIMYQCFKPHIPMLKLDYHNDTSSTDMSIHILSDNFILCDLLSCKCVFDKYSFEFRDYSKEFHCLTPKDWDLIVSNRNIEPKLVLREKLMEFKDKELYEKHQGFPRYYKANRLLVKNGRHINGVIVSTEKTGILTYGPHAYVPYGKYIAEVEIETICGRGNLIVRATTCEGSIKIAEKSYEINTNNLLKVILPFDILDNEGHNFEIVTEMDQVELAVISGVRILERFITSASTIYPICFNKNQMLMSASSSAPMVCSTPTFSISLGIYIAWISLSRPISRQKIDITIKSLNRNGYLSQSANIVEGSSPRATASTPASSTPRPRSPPRTPPCARCCSSTGTASGTSPIGSAPGTTSKTSSSAGAASPLPASRSRARS